MGSFRFGEPSRPTAGKPDPSIVKKLRPDQALGFQAQGFKSALASLKTGPTSFIEKSFKKKTPFIKERILANAPKTLDAKSFKDNLKIEVKNEKTKVSMIVTAEGKNLVKHHEDPSVITSQILEGRTEEGGKGAKFLTRVFDTHNKEIQADTLQEFADGFGSNLKKAKKKG